MKAHGDGVFTRFLSTLSLRRATAERSDTKHYDPISIHALLAESDWAAQQYAKAQTISIHALLAESDKTALGREQIILNFYPRSPCGERPNADWRWPEYFNISIHALLAESDEHLLIIQ